MSQHGIESVGTADQLPAAVASTSARTGAVRKALAAGGWCTAGGAAGYLFGGPVMVAGGLVAVAVVACAIVVVLRSVLFDGTDSRSPFVRLMLLTCVLIGRRPGDYLPPGPGDR